MRPTLIHVRHGRDRWWIIFDLAAVLRGDVGEARDSLIRRWEAKRLPPAEGYARVKGILNPVQAGLEVGLNWRDVPRKVMSA